MPRVTVSMGIFLKNRPEDYRGVTSENWVFGKESDTALAKMLFGICRTVIGFYARFSTADELNKQLDLFREVMAGISMVAPETEISKTDTNR